MTLKKNKLCLCLFKGTIVSIAALGAIPQGLAEDTSTQPKSAEADNTARNKRIENRDAATAQTQSNKQTDIDITANIRKALVADSSLSMKAHNIKVITNAGVVQLKGPVENEVEVAKVRDIAEAVAGTQNVKSHLTVAAKK